jgi:hypothetical protein
MRPTLELLGELAEQTRSLAQVEFALVRAELRGRSCFLKSDESGRGPRLSSDWGRAFFGGG